MNVPIEKMRNLGPKTSQMLAEVDIHNESDLRHTGAIDAYHRLKFRFGSNISLIALYAMEAALRDLDWRALSVECKNELKSAVRDG